MTFASDTALIQSRVINLAITLTAIQNKRCLPKISYNQG